MSAQEGGDLVELYMYDLSKGLATMLFGAYLGKRVEGIWHTAIVLRGREYWFSAGIQQSAPGSTSHGQPMKKVPLGRTSLPDEIIEEYLLELGNSKYSPTSYSLLTNNCNNFSNDVSLFLTGNQIPQEILDMPDTVLRDLMSEKMQASPLGPFIKPIIEMLSRGLGQMHGEKEFSGERAHSASTGPEGATAKASTGTHHEHEHGHAQHQEVGKGHGSNLHSRDL